MDQCWRDQSAAVVRFPPSRVKLLRRLSFGLLATTGAISTAWAATQRALSPLLLAAPSGWSAREMRPHLLGWTQLCVQSLVWFVALAVALAQVR